jgi:hypothetical protein
MNMTALIFQLIGGAFGGYAAGFLKDVNLGTVGAAVAGAIGGGIGGQLLFAILGLSGTAQVVSALVTGGISGGLVALLAGFLKSRMAP